MREFTGDLQGLRLPSAGPVPIVVRHEDDRPQPRLDRDVGGGMPVTVGRIRRRPVHDIRLVALVNNTIRGAAGAAILNAELMVRKGLIGAGAPEVRKVS